MYLFFALVIIHTHVFFYIISSVLLTPETVLQISFSLTPVFLLTTSSHFENLKCEYNLILKTSFLLLLIELVQFIIVGLVCLSAYCYNYTAKFQRHFYLWMVESKY